MKADQFSLRFIDAHPGEAAHSLDLLNREAINTFISSLPQAQAVRILLHMAPIGASHYLMKIPPDQSVQILKRLPPTYAAALIRRMPRENREKFIRHSAVSNTIKELLRFPDGSVGSIMDGEPLVLKKSFSVRETRTYLKKHAIAVQNIIFVTDDEQRLDGYIDIKDLLLAEDNEPISHCIKPVHHKLSTKDRLDTIRDAPFWQYTELVPVIARDGKLMGVLSRLILQNVSPEKDGNLNETGLAADMLLFLAETLWTALADMLLEKSEDNAA